MWIEYQLLHPEQNRDLWYFSEDVGVHKGQYYGDWIFAGKNGFLQGDVTHWQYDNGQTKPIGPLC